MDEDDSHRPVLLIHQSKNLVHCGRSSTKAEGLDITDVGRIGELVRAEVDQRPAQQRLKKAVIGGAFAARAVVRYRISDPAGPTLRTRPSRCR
jgi:hypothetical protein